MKVTSLITQSFGSIWHNKVRSGLTILGIVIGIAAVISLVALGNGLKSTVTDRIGGLGAKNISVQSQDPTRQTAERQRPGGGPGGGGMGGFQFGAGVTETLTTDDYATIKKTAHIAQVSPESSAQVDVTRTADASSATAYELFGVDSDYFAIKSYTLNTGALLSASQVSSGEPAVVLGSQAASELFADGAQPVGKTLYLKDTAYTVVGVLKAQDSEGPGRMVNSALYTGYVNWLSLNGKTKLSKIVTVADKEDAVATAAASIKASLQNAHGIASASKNDFAVTTSKDILNTASNVASSFASTLAGIAGISLVVGGIGIMNIMLATVTERTREIGLRRAVGAKTWHILVQFLVESLLLTTLGGVVGLLAGVVISGHMGSIMTFMPGARGQTVTAVVDATTTLLAVGISAAVGIVFGLFPAIKAARLDPVDALRYE